MLLLLLLLTFAVTTVALMVLLLLFLSSSFLSLVCKVCVLFVYNYYEQYARCPIDSNGKWRYHGTSPSSQWMRCVSQRAIPHTFDEGKAEKPKAIRNSFPFTVCVYKAMNRWNDLGQCNFRKLTARPNDIISYSIAKSPTSRYGHKCYADSNES